MCVLRLVCIKKNRIIKNSAIEMKLNNTEIIQYLRHYIKVLAMDLL